MGGMPWRRAGPRPLGADGSSEKRLPLIRPPGARHIEAEDHAHGRRLSGAVGTEEPRDYTCGNLKSKSILIAVAEP